VTAHRPDQAIRAPVDGFLFLDTAKFAASFAGEVDPDAAAFMADSHVPWGVERSAARSATQRGRTKPSGYLIMTEDRMILPGEQRFVSGRAGATVTEAATSHSVYVRTPRWSPRSSLRPSTAPATHATDRLIRWSGSRVDSMR
jgi:hypothetical protein